MTQTSGWIRDAMLQVMADQADGGRLEILAGSTVLVVVNLPSPAFTPPSGGALKGQPLDATVAIGDGRASEYRVLSRSGGVLWRGSAGGSDADLVLDHPDIQRGMTVDISAVAYIWPGAEG